MPSLRDIRRRMKSVANTGKVTKAMEAVSATKMRKAQHVALAARPYAAKALELLENLSERTEKKPWLMEARTVKRAALLLVTSDKGLCGVLNANVVRAFEKFTREHHVWFAEHACEIIAVGKFGATFAKRKGYAVRNEYAGVGDIVSLEASKPISSFVLHGYENKEFDILYAVYSNFVSTLRQEVVVRQILPLTEASLREMVGGISTRPIVHDPRPAMYRYEYRFEPSSQELLEPLLVTLLEVNMYHMLLEANASEHSARMIAMKNASENAEELLDGLRLSFNKARQAGITREIAEITGGTVALEV